VAQGTNQEERKTLLAAFLGYGVDAFDYMIYTFMIPTLIALWGMTKAQAGYIATGARSPRPSAAGWPASWPTGTGRCACCRHGAVVQRLHLPERLHALTRAGCSSRGRCKGLGFGGEWSVGSVLIAEMIARHRGKAVGLVQSAWAIGWGISALAFWAVRAGRAGPGLARAVLAGVLPALLILYIRRNISDPQVFKDTQARLAASGQRSNFLLIFKPGILRTTVLAACWPPACRARTMPSPPGCRPT
jgi:MFS family permease